jgi:hypothetical protein
MGVEEKHVTSGVNSSQFGCMDLSTIPRKEMKRVEMTVIFSTSYNWTKGSPEVPAHFFRVKKS